MTINFNAFWIVSDGGNVVTPETHYPVEAGDIRKVRVFQGDDGMCVVGYSSGDDSMLTIFHQFHPASLKFPLHPSRMAAWDLDRHWGWGTILGRRFVLSHQDENGVLSMHELENTTVLAERSFGPQPALDTVSNVGGITVDYTYTDQEWVPPVYRRYDRIPEFYIERRGNPVDSGAMKSTYISFSGKQLYGTAGGYQYYYKGFYVSTNILKSEVTNAFQAENNARVVAVTQVGSAGSTITYKIDYYSQAGGTIGGWYFPGANQPDCTFGGKAANVRPHSTWGVNFSSAGERPWLRYGTCNAEVDALMSLYASWPGRVELVSAGYWRSVSKTIYGTMVHILGTSDGKTRYIQHQTLAEIEKFTPVQWGAWRSHAPNYEYSELNKHKQVNFVKPDEWVMLAGETVTRYKPSTSIESYAYTTNPWGIVGNGTYLALVRDADGRAEFLSTVHTWPAGTYNYDLREYKIGNIFAGWTDLKGRVFWLTEIDDGGGYRYAVIQRVESPRSVIAIFVDDSVSPDPAPYDWAHAASSDGEIGNIIFRDRQGGHAVICHVKGGVEPELVKKYE